MGRHHLSPKKLHSVTLHLGPFGGLGGALAKRLRTRPLPQARAFVKSAKPKVLQRTKLKNAQNTFFGCLFILFCSHKKLLFLQTSYKARPQEESITLKNLGKIKPPWKLTQPQGP